MCTNEQRKRGGTVDGWAVGAGRGSRFESTLGSACCGIAESNR